MMSLPKLRWLLLVAVALALLPVRSGAQTSYVAVDLGFVGSGPGSIQYQGVRGLNAYGQVVSVNSIDAFEISDGTTTDFATILGFSQVPIVANGINDVGTVIGYVTGPSATSGSILVPIAFIYANGVPTHLPKNSSANGINAAGTVVGSVVDPSFFQQGFIYSQGAFTTFGAFGTPYNTYAVAVNAAGQIAGYAESPNFAGLHAYRFSGFPATDLGVLPGGTDSVATAINGSGQVVGFSESSSLSDLGTTGALIVAWPQDM
jgi:probable HAF family extracellular repeat protein